MKPLLSITSLRRTFGALAAVDNVNLRLETGDRHAVIGPNGAGKTTLLNLIAGNLRPTTGRIRYADRDITHLPPNWRSRLGIARTFQSPALCNSLTVLDNIVLGGWHHTGTRRLPWATRHRQLVVRAMRLLEMIGLTHLADHKAGTLSHGRRRLLEIGVALAARPRLLLLDEPAAGLTDHDLTRLADVLTDLTDDVTMLLVEHHLDLVTTIAHSVTMLHHGTVLVTGTPSQVLRHPAVVGVYRGTEPT